MSWEVDWKVEKNERENRKFWARNLESKNPNARKWHWVRAEFLRNVGLEIPKSKFHNRSWEVDWSHPGNTGYKVWARNLNSHLLSGRQWHWTATGYLRFVGINTPKYRKDSWEVDWGRRQGKMVWARNPESKMPKAREWHWIENATLIGTGVAWKPKNERTGRGISNGYVRLTRNGMTEEEIHLAKKFNLFKTTRKTHVWEHQLEAVKKYGKSLDGLVVRHLNGVKTDNRQENLVLGTTQENTMDHNKARLMAMFWRDKCEQAEKKLAELTG